MQTTRQITSAAALTLLAGAATAQTIPLTVNLSGANEVPPNSSPATGLVNATWNPTTREFAFAWSISNLTGNPASPGAHIHRGLSGANGPVVFGFANPDGTWPLTGSSSWIVPAADVPSFESGGFYFNFHTTAFPSGEIRGQIIVPSPAGTAVLAGAGLLAMRRRRR